MGSFSFIKADVKDSENILYGDTVKLLIPIEFGGGYIKGKYVDYGRIDENGIEYDIYELAGIWNSPKILKALKGLFSNPARKQSDIWDNNTDPTQGFERWGWQRWKKIFSTELGYAEYFEKCKATKKRKNPMKEVENDTAKAIEKINSLNRNAEAMLQ